MQIEEKTKMKQAINQRANQNNKCNRKQEIDHFIALNKRKADHIPPHHHHWSVRLHIKHFSPIFSVGLSISRWEDAEKQIKIIIAITEQKLTEKRNCVHKTRYGKHPRNT